MGALTVSDRVKASSGARRLARVLAPIGCAATAVTAYRTISSGLPISFYDASAVLASMLFAGLNFYLALTRYSRGKAIAQSIAVLSIGALGVFLSSDPAAFGTPMLVSIGVLLGLKNGAFTRIGHALVVYSAIVVADVLLALLAQNASLLDVLYSLVPGIAVFAILYYVFHEDLRRIMVAHRRLRAHASEVETRAVQLNREIEAARRRAAEATSVAEAEHTLVDRLQRELADLSDRIVEVDPLDFNLTNRETEVLRLLVTKMASNKEIADELGFTERTAKSHIYNIFNKIGVDRRLEVIEMFRWSFDDAKNSR